MWPLDLGSKRTTELWYSNEPLLLLESDRKTGCRAEGAETTGAFTVTSPYDCGGAGGMLEKTLGSYTEGSSFNWMLILALSVRGRDRECAKACQQNECRWYQLSVRNRVEPLNKWYLFARYWHRERKNHKNTLNPVSTMISLSLRYRSRCAL